jgi:hypothetical protein
VKAPFLRFCGFHMGIDWGYWASKTNENLLDEDMYQYENIELGYTHFWVV